MILLNACVIWVIRGPGAVIVKLKADVGDTPVIQLEKSAAAEKSTLLGLSKKPEVTSRSGVTETIVPVDKRFWTKEKETPSVFIMFVLLVLAQ